METRGKYFLNNLIHHLKAHLAEFHSDSNSVPPYCGLGNNTAIQGIAVFHAFHSSKYP